MARDDRNDSYQKTARLAALVGALNIADRLEAMEGASHRRR
jgi:hypothetical protein